MKKLLFVLLVPVLVLGLMGCKDEALSVFNPDKAVLAELQGMYTNTATAADLQTLITASQMTVIDKGTGGNVTLGVETDIFIGRFLPGTITSSTIVIGYDSANSNSVVVWDTTADDDTNFALFTDTLIPPDSWGYVKLFRLDDWKPVATLSLDLAQMNSANATDFVLATPISSGFIKEITELYFYQKELHMDYFNHVIPLAAFGGQETYERVK